MKKKLVPLKKILSAIDTGNRKLWDEFTAEEKKEISFYLLTRYASSIKGNFVAKDVPQTVLLRTNDIYNKHWNEIYKHKKLMWQLLCLICKDVNLTIKKQNNNTQYPYHEWIGFKHKESNSKQKKFLLDKFPNMKLDEIDMILKLSDKKQLSKYIKDHDID